MSRDANREQSTPQQDRWLTTQVVAQHSWLVINTRAH